MRKPVKCQGCGHVGGALALGDSAVLRQLVAATAAPVEVPRLWLCAGELFAEDGAAACLRRQAAR